MVNQLKCLRMRKFSSSKFCQLRVQSPKLPLTACSSKSRKKVGGIHHFSTCQFLHSRFSTLTCFHLRDFEVSAREQFSHFYFWWVKGSWMGRQFVYISSACVGVYSKGEFVRIEVDRYTDFSDIKEKSLLDSEAAFKKRVIEIGDETLFQTLDNSGLKTFSGLAFACGTPQSQPDDTAFGTFAAGVFGAPPTLGQLSQLRRLHFEACTIVFATLKSNVAGDLTDGIRKLPPAEKQARAKDQQNRLTGITLSGEMEPSYALVDKCASMRETGSLLWIHPSQCTKREQEVQQTLKEKSQVLKIENMTLKMAADTETFEADHGTELKLMWCFQRRGLAFDQAALISWDRHESWVAAMFQAYSAEPPPSFAKVTMPQLLRADKELFTILAREVETIQPDTVGNRPLDEAITRLKTDPRVTMHLLPLPTKAHSVEASNAAKPDNARPKPKPRPGKRARAANEVKMPDELKGGHSKTVDNKPICWAFNMKDGCSAKTYGNPVRCSKGVHICAFCRKGGHTFLTCRQRGSDWLDGEQPAKLQQAESHPRQHDEGLFKNSEPPEGLFANLDNSTEWKDLLVVEIFAGTARLSRAFTKRDFRVSSVDHTTKRSTGLITILDLTKEEDLNFLLDFLKAELNVLVYIHLAPPCGTASAARGIPVPGCPQEMQPAPLRTKEFPDGLPGLTGLNLLKVEKANALYRATSIIVQFCVLHGILVSIENPLNSLFWLTKPMVELFELCEGYRIVFDSCMMGGQRDKATLW